MTGQQLKNSILQLAIQGKLVPQDPNDEPASVLLQRIRKEKEQLVKTGQLKKKDLISEPITEDEKPFDIPESWEWCRLGELFLHTSGKQQSSSNKGGGTPQKFITTSNLYWERFELDIVKVMDFTEEEIKTCSATKGDLLVCEGGAGYGRSAIWDKDYDICLQNHVHRLRPLISGTCEFVLKFIYLLKETNQLASVGTAMPGLSANRLKSIVLPLPPLSEQQRIVAKIEELMPLVEDYDKAQKELNDLNEKLPEQLKKSILQQAIMGKLVPQDPADEPASVLLQRIRKEKEQLVKEGKLKKKDLETTPIADDEKPFDIPESWEWCRLGEIIKLLSGQDLTPNRYSTTRKGIPYITGASNFVDGNIIENRWTETPVSISKLNDLLITCKGTIGEMAFNQIGDIHIARQIMAISSFIVDSIFIMYYIKANLSSFAKEAKSMIPGISRDVLLSAVIPLPPLAEQQRIVAKIEELFALLEKK